jgi:uncharacterized ParB-like nuclease family protein
MVSSVSSSKKKQGKKIKGNHARVAKPGSANRQPLKKNDTSERKAVAQASAPVDQQTAPPSSKPIQLRISKIVVRPNRRKLDNEAVMTITESMRKLGQLQPIMVRKIAKPNGKTTFVLVDGDHRREAGKALGWEKIAAVFFHGDEDAARVYELTQNLQRADNTRLYPARKASARRPACSATPATTSVGRWLSPACRTTQWRRQKSSVSTTMNRRFCELPSRRTRTNRSP